MIPKIYFNYSFVYDDHWKSISETLARKIKKYPSQKEIYEYIKKVESEWEKCGDRILTEISKISGLKWNDQYIYCYVVGNCIPFSDPLTIPVYENVNDFIDVLTHELIHQLFIQLGNDKKSEKSWDHIYKKYKNESESSKIHIPLHAIHNHIYLKLFDKERLQRDIEFMSGMKDYERAWNAVKKEGYRKIIKEFKERLTI